MVLVVAERVNNPQMPPEKVEKWAEMWEANCVRCFHLVQGMVWGQSRRRLSEMLGREPDRVGNLLSPDRVCGTWDKEKAKRYAEKLRFYLDAPDSGNPSMHNEDGERGVVTHVVLCGRRVLDAWPENAKPSEKDFQESDITRWGLWWEWRGVRYITLPHPSPRSRVMNDDVVSRLVKNRVREFFSDIEQTKTVQ